MDPENRIARREIFDGRVVRLSVDTVSLPNGRQAELEVIRHPGAAAVVPIDETGRVLLVRQYRYAAGGWLLEVPAGKLDPGEEPELCARRELEEETGFRCEKLVPLGSIFTTPGFTDERIWLYLATGLRASEQTLQHDEVLTVESLLLDEAVELALDGKIRDAKTVCGLLRAARVWGDGPPLGASR